MFQESDSPQYPYNPSMREEENVSPSAVNEFSNRKRRVLYPYQTFPSSITPSDPLFHISLPSIEEGPRNTKRRKTTDAFPIVVRDTESDNNRSAIQWMNATSSPALLSETTLTTTKTSNTPADNIVEDDTMCITENYSEKTSTKRPSTCTLNNLWWKKQPEQQPPNVNCNTSTGIQTERVACVVCCSSDDTATAKKSTTTSSNSILSYFQTAPAPSAARLGSIATNKDTSGGAVTALKMCSYCDRPSCRDCTRTCVNCESEFCSFCTTINYDAAYERVFCFDCEPTCVDEDTMNIG